MAEKRAKTYKQLSEELAGIIEWFENGEVDIDSAIKRYEEAQQLIAQIEDYLMRTENKIKRISLNK